MIRLIVSVLLLGIGFGAGVFWGVHHPREAARVTNTEVENMRVLQARIHDYATKQQGKGGIAGTGIGSNLIGNNTAPTADPDLQELDNKAQRQLDALKAKLDQ